MNHFKYLVMLAFALAGPVAMAVTITQAEYYLDSDPGVGLATAIPITAGESVSISGLLASTTGLNADQVHRIFLRYLSSEGVWSSTIGRYFYLLSPASGTVDVKLITELDYWFDADAPTTIDLPDASTANFANLIPQTLDNGIHTFSLRYRDDEGLNSFTEARRFVIISQTTSNYQPGTIVAAEFFINGNPAPGSAVPIPLPIDGEWDEGEESASVVVTDLPVGYHLFCVRYLDNFGVWSSTVCDSVKVTPILVIQRSGDDILLTWQADPLHIPFHIYRSDSSDGTYADIAQTNSLNYLDAGVLNLPKNRNFYYVTTTPTALSSFRMPASPAENPVTR